MKLASTMLKGLTIKNIAIKNMTLTYLNENDKFEKHTALKNLNINITGLSVDRGLQMARLQFSTPDSLYRINFDELQLSNSNRTLLIGRTTIEPRLK